MGGEKITADRLVTMIYYQLSTQQTLIHIISKKFFQLGVSDTDDKCQPTQLATLRSLGVRYITAGSDHTAFLTQVNFEIVQSINFVDEFESVFQLY